jgi:hypothetical protein
MKFKKDYELFFSLPFEQSFLKLLSPSNSEMAPRDEVDGARAKLPAALRTSTYRCAYFEEYGKLCYQTSNLT